MVDLPSVLPNLNLNSISAITNSINQYIVTPANAFGIGGFVFDIEGEQQINLTAEITDHYTESNQSVQDHIAIRPKRLILKSYVGELVYDIDPNSNTPIQNVVQKLTTLQSFLPQLAAGEGQIATLAASITNPTSPANFNNITNAGVSLWSLIKNLFPPTERQQQAYLYFKALWEQKILVSVQTPFEYMNQMAIESIVAVQPEESRYISHFTIILKEIRFASTLVEATNSAQAAQSQTPPAQGRNDAQSAPVTNVGNVGGTDPAQVVANLPTNNQSFLPPPLPVKGSLNMNGVVPLVTSTADIEKAIQFGVLKINGIK